MRRAADLPLLLLLACVGCPPMERRPREQLGPDVSAPPPPAPPPDLGPIVDIHCHVFNARDLPMEEFLTAHGSPPRLATFVKLVVSAISEDDPILLRALSPEMRSMVRRGSEAVARPDAATDPELFVLEGLFRLAEAGPLREELDQLASGPRAEGTLGDWAGQAKDALRWALVLSRRREALAARLVETYPDTALFTPLVVDMNHWFADREAVPGSYDEQHDTMRALIGTWKGKMFPFASFDPERERLRRLRPGGERPLVEVLRGLAEEGFLGVKLYPPFGFRPARNADLAHDHACAVKVLPQVRASYDAILEELFAACQALDLCVAAHCEDPGAGLAQCAEHADPRWWADALSRHPDLRLNLMHMGGAEGLVERPGESWARKVAELMHRYPRVYADVGAEVVPSQPQLRSRFFARLDELEREMPGVRGRIMFGTDWHLLVRHSDHELFERRYLQFWSERWGAESARRFAGGAALEYLGLRQGGNRERVRALFARNGWPLPAWLR